MSLNGDGERSLLRGQNWAGAEGKVALADPCLARGLNNRRACYVNRGALQLPSELAIRV